VCGELGSDAISQPVSLLIGAGLAVLCGDVEAAAAGYRSAAPGFDAVDMVMHAAVTRWRLGELVGGDEGRALVAQARAVLAAEGIVRPERVLAMFAPVPADARRISNR
jgi:hypothetical protein